MVGTRPLCGIGRKAAHTQSCLHSWQQHWQKILRSPFPFLVLPDRPPASLQYECLTQEAPPSCGKQAKGGDVVMPGGSINWLSTGQLTCARLWTFQPTYGPNASRLT